MEVLADEEERPQGILRVTMAVDVAEALMADIVARFSERYPGVFVEVDVTGRLVNLLEEGFDIAIRATPKLKDSSMVARKLCKTEIMLFASPAYLAKKGAPKAVEELERHTCVLFYPSGTRTDLLGLKPFISRPRFVGTDFCYVRALIASGAGIGPLPSYSARAAVEAGTLVRVIPEWSAPGSWLHLLYPSAPHVPKKVVAFRDFVVEAFATAEEV